jgi:hypothetical protein
MARGIQRNGLDIPAWIQMDEPCLVKDLDETAQGAFCTAYRDLNEVSNIHLMLTTYFGGLEETFHWPFNCQPLAFTSIWCARLIN